MHAIHKNAAEFPRPNLYLIIDVRLVDSDGTPSTDSTPHASDHEEGDGGGGEEDGGITEIRYTPDSPLIRYGGYGTVLALNTWVQEVNKAFGWEPEEDAGNTEMRWG